MSAIRRWISVAGGGDGRGLRPSGDGNPAPRCLLFFPVNLDQNDDQPG